MRPAARCSGCSALPRAFERRRRGAAAPPGGSVPQPLPRPRCRLPLGAGHALGPALRPRGSCRGPRRLRPGPPLPSQERSVLAPSGRRRRALSGPGPRPVQRGALQPHVPRRHGDTLRLPRRPTVPCSAPLRGRAAPPAGGPSPARGPRPCLSASRAFAPGRLFAFLSCPPRRAACAWACWARCVALRGMSALPRTGDGRGTCPPSRGSSRLARRRGDGGGTCPLLRVISSCARGAVPPTHSLPPQLGQTGVVE